MHGSSRYCRGTRLSLWVHCGDFVAALAAAGEAELGGLRLRLLRVRAVAAIRRATAAAPGHGAGEPLARGLGDELALALLGDESVGVCIGVHRWLLGDGDSASAVSPE